jgi:NADH-quinone oxidoreductase subunit M
MNFRELATVVPLIVLVFWIGLYPKPFLKTFDASVEHLLTKVSPDNFGPGRPGSSHSTHAKLVKVEDIARLNQQQNGIKQ